MATAGEGLVLDQAGSTQRFFLPGAYLWPLPQSQECQELSVRADTFQQSMLLTSASGISIHHFSACYESRIQSKGRDQLDKSKHVFLQSLSCSRECTIWLIWAMSEEFVFISLGQPHYWVYSYWCCILVLLSTIVKHDQSLSRLRSDCRAHWSSSVANLWMMMVMINEWLMNGQLQGIITNNRVYIMVDDGDV